MKTTLCAVVLGFSALLWTHATPTTLAASVPAAKQETPAERAIRRGETQVKLAEEKGRVDSSALCDLAWAYARRARETGDPAWYDRADECLDKAAAVRPDDYETRRTRVWTQLGQHRFADALASAQELQKAMPDDVMVYGMITDACMELGRYEEAEAAAQWMLDLRPGTVPGLTRGAYLREIFGDVEGAVEFLRSAYARVRPSEVEDRAWILVHLAHLERKRGRPSSAERLVAEALRLFPDYHYALAELGRIRLAQERPTDALAVFQKRYELASHPEHLLDVARAHAAAGQSEQAAEAYQTFEKAAVAESQNLDNCNRDLLLYWVAAGRAQEAVALAESELALRQDVLTLDAVAWVFQATGRLAEAHELIERALAVGIADAEMCYHAGVIAGLEQNPEKCRQHLRRALDIDPFFPSAPAARRMLAGPAPDEVSGR